MKIVINKCYGGFRLSKAALDKLEDIQYDQYENRTNKKLIEVIEELGEEANGSYSNLKVIEIPDGISYDIFDYDGVEVVVEIGHFWS